MEIGSCAMVLITFVTMVVGCALFIFGSVTVGNFWNKPPNDPPANPPNGPFSKALRYMKDEANRLGINMYRVACVAACLMLVSFVSWGGVTAYNTVTVVPCGDGDVAIKIPDPAKRVMVAAGVPSPCDCGDE